MTTFDSHAAYNRLIDAGVPERQADALVTIIAEQETTDLSNVATKADLAELKADIYKMMVIQSIGIITIVVTLIKWVH